MVTTTKEPPVNTIPPREREPLQETGEERSVETEISEPAIGFIETRGFAGLVHATDAMNKAASVSFLRQEHIGSAYVTTMVTGAVGAVKAAVDAGFAAGQETGEVVVAHVIPRLHRMVRDVCLDWRLPDPTIPAPEALGLIETVGFVGMIEAADAAVKAADVSITNYFTVGSGFATISLRGQTSEIESAIEAARDSAGRIAKIRSSTVIPSPHPGLHRRFRFGSPADSGEGGEGGSALGYLETRGFTALVEGTDAGLKAAGVSLAGYRRIGGGMVTSILRGDVSAVRAAIEAAEEAAGRVGEVLATNVIPSAVRELVGG